MDVLWAFALVIAVTVLLCEAGRLVLRSVLRPGLKQDLAMELLSTLQLCCCVREMVLINRWGGLAPEVCLSFTFLFTLIHSVTAGATCNPCCSLQMWLRNEAPGLDTVLRVAAQYTGAALSLLVMPAVWSLKLSAVHLGDPCINPLTVSPLYGAGVELLCTLGLFSMLRNLDRVGAEYRVYVVALVITAMVYVGGPLTGAVFNPALAFTTVWHCVGNLSEYAFVYCLGPLIGLLTSILVFDKGIPKLSSSAPKRTVSSADNRMKDD